MPDLPDLPDHAQPAPPAEPSRRRWWRRIRRWLVFGVFVTGLVGALVAGTLAVVIVRYGAVDRAQPADAIIVLGGGPSGTERRTRHAVALYDQGYAPVIVCSGGYVWPESEAQRCAAVAIARGVPPGAIMLEDRSLSTEENAIEVAAIMHARGWDDAVLVSDDFHLWRANWLFESQGVTVYPSPAQITDRSMSTRDTAFNVAREVAATVWHAGKSVLGLSWTRVGD